MGHLFSSCWTNPTFLTLGTSCGTIALLPIEISRYFRLKKVDYFAAKKRRRFLYMNLTINFILNFLAIFHLDLVDWVSHVGAIVSGILFTLYYEDFQSFNSVFHRKRQLLRFLSLSCVIVLYIILFSIILFYLPLHEIGLN